MSEARYAIGVDLGTTDCALPYVDLAAGEEDPGRQQTMAVTQLGTRLDHWEVGKLQELGEIELTLPADRRTPGEIVPVKLRAAVSEAGTLQLEAIPREGAERWQVEFDVRS